MTFELIIQFLVLPGALLMGARAGGVGLGLRGAVGLLVLVVGLGIPPGAIPGEVLIIVLTVIMAALAVLLMLGLTKTSDVTKLQQYFYEYRDSSIFGASHNTAGTQRHKEP